MGKCKKHPKGKGHVWVGNGPDRECKNCGESPKEPHISTGIEGGEEKYRKQAEQMKLDRKSMKGRGGNPRWNNKNGKSPPAKRDRSKK